MFRFDTASATIHIYGDIFPSEYGGIDDVQVVDALATMQGRRVKVRINSRGGDVDLMVGIYNALERHTGGVDTFNDGWAASAGHYIFMVGENRTMARNATGFVHNPIGLAIGNSKELRETADMMDIIGATMQQTYVDITKKSPEQIAEWLDKETWFNAQASLEAGFATAIGNSVTADEEVAASVAEIRAAIKETGHTIPKNVQDKFKQEAPYRIAAKLKAIKLRNQFARSR